MAGCSRPRGLAGVGLLIAVSIVAASCGKKGPPLAPLRLVPGPVADLTVRRVGPDVQLRFKLPTANANGPGRVDLDYLEVFAVTVAPDAVTPPNRELLTKPYSIGTISVKPLPIEGDGAPPEGAPPDPRPGPGDEVSFVEPLTDARLVPAKLPKLPAPVVTHPGVPALPPVTPLVFEPAAPAPGAPPAGVPPLPAPTAAFPAPTLVQTTIVRLYTLRGVAVSGRPGQPSPRLIVPIVPPPPPPTAAKASFTDQAVVVEWTPPAATAGPAPAPALAFNVYRAPTAAETGARPDPAAKPGAPAPAAGTKPEGPLNPSPLADPKLELPGVEFGAERCFSVRSVEVVQAVAIESDATPATCVIPRDIFPPAAPAGLSLLLLDGAIELVWDANTEADIAGYTILRGEAPGDTLRPLTPAPVREATFRDSTVRPGAHYIYAVVAVDRAGNASPPSARVEGNAR
jgi:hypothetical protein